MKLVNTIVFGPLLLNICLSPLYIVYFFYNFAIITLYIALFYYFSLFPREGQGRRKFPVNSHAKAQSRKDINERVRNFPALFEQGIENNGLRLVRELPHGFLRLRVCGPAEFMARRGFIWPTPYRVSFNNALNISGYWAQ